jgi:hypothetical protein
MSNTEPKKKNPKKPQKTPHTIKISFDDIVNNY